MLPAVVEQEAELRIAYQELSGVVASGDLTRDPLRVQFSAFNDYVNEESNAWGTQIFIRCRSKIQVLDHVNIHFSVKSGKGRVLENSKGKGRCHRLQFEII